MTGLTLKGSSRSISGAQSAMTATTRRQAWWSAAGRFSRGSTMPSAPFLSSFLGTCEAVKDEVDVELLLLPVVWWEPWTLGTTHQCHQPPDPEAVVRPHGRYHVTGRDWHACRHCYEVGCSAQGSAQTPTHDRLVCLVLLPGRGTARGSGGAGSKGWW